MVQDVEDQLEASKKNEGGIMHEIDKEMREVEKLKSSLVSLSNRPSEQSLMRMRVRAFDFKYLLDT